MGPLEGSGDPTTHDCPGADAASRWDEPELLRGALLTREQLAAHAAVIAKAHGEPLREGTPSPLARRLGETRARLFEAYEILRRGGAERELSAVEARLLESGHVIDGEIRAAQHELEARAVRQLPRISAPGMRGYPRIYGLCLDYLRHTDGRIDAEVLVDFVQSYQGVRRLTLGELWALPSMLRLGLLLRAAALAPSRSSEQVRAHTQAWAERLLRGGAPEPPPAKAGASASRFDARSPAALVRLLSRVREHDGPIDAPRDWIAARCAELGTTPEELSRREHLRQAADEISMQNALAGMRAVGALDWEAFLRRTSEVELILDADPAGAYRRSDRATRERYRRAVEQLAARSRKDEVEVGLAAYALASAALDAPASSRRPGTERPATLAGSHIGYYLVGEGRDELEHRVGYRPAFGTLWRRALLAEPAVFHAFAVAAVAVALLGAFGGVLEGARVGALRAMLLLLAAAFPASEVALELVSCLGLAFLPARPLMKLDFSRGIPDEQRTLVAMSVALDSPAGIEARLEELRVASLANPDHNLHFALLTDFCGPPATIAETGAELLDQARRGVLLLNEAAGGRRDRFWLLHRPLVHGPTPSGVIGWERRRGQLEELGRLLRGDESAAFSFVLAPRDRFASIRNVITLHAGSRLPRQVAAELVATIAHPLNRPELDAERSRVVRGHGIIQPRLGTSPESTRRSRFARIPAGDAGIDPYTTSLSDVEQDLFGEATFLGAGIYDVDALSAVLARRGPETRSVGHATLAGIFARSALASDIELLEEGPASYGAWAARRQERMRADWQLLPWLMPAVPGPGRSAPALRPFDAWRVLDRLRRALLAPALAGLAVASWFAPVRVAGAAAVLLAGAFVLPVIARACVPLARETSSPARPRVAPLVRDVGSSSARLLVELVVLPDLAWLSFTAGARAFLSLLGMSAERRDAASSYSRAGAPESVPIRLWIAGLASLFALGVVVTSAPRTWPFVMPPLLAWTGAPLLAAWLSLPRQIMKVPHLSDADRLLLRGLAHKTWRFFDELVGEEDHHLPPERYQEEPSATLSHRTSPMDIGLYLLSVASARDLGLIGARDARQRLARTLGTLERLDKHAGHLLEAYDTTSLRPLEPQRVSTLESGVLCAQLWTLRVACVELPEQPFVSALTLEAVCDALALVQHERELGALERRARALLESAAEPLELMRALSELGGELPQQSARAGARPASREVADWLARAERLIRSALEEVAALAPWLAAPAPLARLESVPELAEASRHLWSRLLALSSPAQVRAEHGPLLREIRELREALDAAGVSAALSHECTQELEALARMIESGAEACSEHCAGVARLAEQAAALAAAMGFQWLFDERRELLSTGYDVSSARLADAQHDLLASEARLASFVGIARGDLPQSHWLRLGRPRAQTSGGATLLSWHGSTLEYMLPLLCTRSFDGSLLDQACRAALARQRQYAAERGVPWGISDCAEHVLDVAMSYRARAFGVPGLGLRSGLGRELVIAPYATFLAGLLRPDWICKNLRALRREGLEGAYGLYESIDYTPEHVPPGRRSAVVKACMARHQGMSLVALGEILLGAPMQRRFHSDARVRATESLLEERVPLSAPPRSPATLAAAAPRVEARAEAVDRVGLESPGPLRLSLLGHGELSSIISATGAGVTLWRGLDVNRFREDPVLEAGGIYLYVKNRTHNRLWSAAYQPTRAEPSFYNVELTIDRVEFKRKDGDVQTLTEIAPSPEHPVELRRVTLTNQGEGALELELTSYTEVVLAPRGADVAHRAFSNMFVETEALPERFALLAKRRPRLHGEPEVWMVQALVAESGGFGALDYDCSRLRFLGRGRSTAEPEALAADTPLAKQAGLMLDTALALRRNARLGPGTSARLTLVTGLAATRQEALALLDLYSAKEASARALELGWARARVQLGHLGVTPVEVHHFQRLLSAVVFPHPMLRHGARPAGTLAQGQAALGAEGISGDLPIVLCRIDDPEFAELCRDVLLAHELWRLSGFASDLVFIDERDPDQAQAVAARLREITRSAPSEQRGGVFLRRAARLGEESREALFSVARVVLRAKEGSLARQLRRVLDVRPLPPLLAPPGARERAPRAEPALERPKLTYDNGIGGFGPEGREYVMLLEPGVRTPAPWCNVISNPEFGTLVSEVGSSVTWAKSSQRYRLTPWNNDVVSDPSGELLYIRDDDDGSYWSATPEPLGRAVRHLVRHGQGYSQFEHEHAGLALELTLFVSPDEPIKFSRLRIENRGGAERRLSIFAYVEWVLGNNREASRVSVSTSHDAQNDILLAHNPLGLLPASRGFLAATRPSASVSGDRVEFFGSAASRAAPEALSRVRLSGNVGAGLDPAGALSVEIEIRAGESVDLAILLGHADSLEQAQGLCAKYRREGAVNEALGRARKTWVDLLGAVRVKTPDRAFDLMQNNWLLYQSLSSRVWGRTGFFQSSGAYGYRDQLQDVLASIHARPSIAREHLLRAASRQFLEGDVQHWWHDETGHGLRTRCSDDMLWLPFVTAEYVRMTGDRAVLDELVPFLSERPLRPGEEEMYTAPSASELRASLYEHCKRALDAGLTRGEHGLPLMRAGDWNDGMNRVGIEGRGESVWLAWFLVKTLTEFAQVAHLMDDAEREASSLAEAKRIAKAVDEHAWDGEWYRRASFDDGTWIGARESDECSIDAIAQSWAVIAGQADPERAAAALAASEARLIVPSLRMMKLLTLPFEHTRPDPGYIQSYPAGIRENGGQYTHGVLWTVLALALLGAGDRAGELLGFLNPIRHADTPDGVHRYRVEPYVVAADVYGGSGYEGRGGWTWYTGSAGWMYRIGLEYVLGLRRRGRTLAIAPCIPSSWSGFELEYRYGTATYHIVVENPDRVCHGVTRLELDGQRVAEGYIRLDSDERVHEVLVTLGRMQSSRAARASLRA